MENKLMDNEKPDLLPYDLYELPKKELEEKLKEIGETESSRKNCLNIFIQRIKEQEEFKPCTDEQFLLRFLRHAKFDCDIAFYRLKRFYGVQKKNPQFFEYNSRSALPKAQFNHVYISPYRMKDNSVLYIHKFYAEEMSTLPARDKFYLDTIITEDFLERPINQMCGASFIMDLNGMTLSKILHYTPKLLKMQFEVLHNSFPYRVKAIHVVNSSAIFRIFFNIAYPIMPKKLQQRLHIHSDSKHWSDLHNYVPPKMLPKEYGGYLEDTELINAMESIYETEEKFRKITPFFYPSQ